MSRPEPLTQAQCLHVRETTQRMISYLFRLEGALRARGHSPAAHPFLADVTRSLAALRDLNGLALYAANTAGFYVDGGSAAHAFPCRAPAGLMRGDGEGI